MKAADLKTRSMKDLVSMAKKKKVAGSGAMRKEQLVKALLKQEKATPAKSSKPVKSPKISAKKPAKVSAKASLPRKSTAKVASKSTHTSVNGKASLNGAARSARTAVNSVKASATKPIAASKVVAPKAVASKTPIESNGKAATVAAAKITSANGTGLNGSAVLNGLKTPPSSVNGKAAHGNAVFSRIHTNGTANAGQNGKHVIESPVSEAEVVVAQAPVVKKRSPQVERRLQQVKSRLAEAKDISFHFLDSSDGPNKDRLVVMVLEPYWLHCYWELSRRSVQRAEAAMGALWHAARPVLRLLEVSRNGTTSAARQAVRDIEIHGGVNNWYIDVANPPKGYQVEIGYLAPGGKFFCLARSNGVTTPAPGSSDAFDRNWAGIAKQVDRIYAMTAGSTEQESSGDLKDVMEEHLHRPIGDGLAAQVGPGASGNRNDDFNFQVDTELIVHGATRPDARVTLRGEPVPVRSDGSFAVRFNLPDRRHVLPVVAQSGDGAEQRTIVLAVDRNTKVMETVVRDPGERT
jgi:hypothetical protein